MSYEISNNSAIHRITVKYMRGELVEEFHTGILQCLNEPARNEVFYLRSCAKPLQASLLIDYDIDLSDEELAFCSGSHAGETCHINVANNLLKKFGLEACDLKCGVHSPLSRTMQDRMLLNNETATTLHNNCSGKHLGFLAICRKMGWSLDDYYAADHPLQIAIKNKIYELCEVDENIQYPMTTDGCGVPIVSMPLYNLLLGYKNLAENYPKLINAIIKNPYIYGGENRLDTEIIQNSDGLIAKVGAGGLCVVYNIAIEDGFVVKIDDASMPARRVAVLEIINSLDWADIKLDKSVKTLNGDCVGEIIATF